MSHTPHKPNPSAGRHLRRDPSLQGLEELKDLQEFEDPHRGRKGRRLYVIHVRGRGSWSPFGGLYVGQTSQSRHARFAEHRAGGPRSGAGLAGNCECLRPELYAHLRLLPDDKSIAQRAEAALANRLADAGFAVQTDGRHYKPRPDHNRVPFTAADLRRVDHKLRQRLVLDLVQDDLATIAFEQVVHALRKSSAVDYGELAPGLEGRKSVGRLAHVEKAAVEDLVEQILGPFR